MRSKILLASLVVISVSALTAIADPMGWFDWYAKGKTTIKSTFKCSREQPCWLIAEAWDDGSANFRVVPMTSGWPEDKLPHHGLITVNGKTFRMAQRKEEDKTILFGSVPVGTFDLTEPMTYTLLAYDVYEKKLVDDWCQW
ncbi:MAG: hypothetical protein KF841_10705 [Phycisphaerae bacterium]|nr:hypothetical protein [Phycisphaerae bacterium]